MIFKTSVALFIALSFACGGATTQNRTANVDNVRETPVVQATSEPRTVSFASAGVVVISGIYRSAAKPNTPAVLLLHQWRGDYSAYDDLALKLSKLGFAVLAVDGRGFGASVRTSDGRAVEPARSDASVGAMKIDIDNAFKFLSSQTNVDPNRVGIVGASYGGSPAIIYAAENKKVKAVALLSPGIKYFGNIPTDPAAREFGDRALMMIAAKDDKKSADAVEKLRQSAPGAQFFVFERGGHGTNLLNSSFDVSTKLADFLVRSP